MSRTKDIELNDLAEVTTKVEKQMLKVIIIGDAPVGKSEFINRYVHGKFCSPGKVTIGVDFALKTVDYRNLTVNLQFWDINGSERGGSMTKLYYKEASACVIMFDVTRRLSFEHVVLHKNDVDSKVKLSNGRPVPCLLLANKIDLPSHCVTDEEIEELCNKHNFIGWRKISVKDNTNIEQSMNFLLEETINRLYLPS